MSTLVGTWQCTWLKQERILSQLLCVSWDRYSQFCSDHKFNIGSGSVPDFFNLYLFCPAYFFFLDPQVYKYKGILGFFKAVFACSSIPLTLLTPGVCHPLNFPASQGAGTADSRVV